LWTLGLVLGFAAMQWATRSDLTLGHPATFGDDLFFSAGGFLSAGTGLEPEGTASQALFIFEAASGFAVLFIAIGYLPALFQAFSRREVAISQLDPRAGSPPSAGALIERSGALGGWESLDEYLGEWETWSAELMETHPLVSVPRLLPLAAPEPELARGVDDGSRRQCVHSRGGRLAASRRSGRGHVRDGAPCAGGHRADAQRQAAPARSTAPRRPSLQPTLGARGRSGLELREQADARKRLHDLRKAYEPFAVALAGWLELALPSWVPSPEAEANWRRAVLVGRRRRGPEL
jgi:hypothetical protein